VTEDRESTSPQILHVEDCGCWSATGRNDDYVYSLDLLILFPVHSAGPQRINGG
jgi:hypothetical protein